MRDIMKFEWLRCLRSKGFRLALFVSFFLVALNNIESYKWAVGERMDREFPYIFIETWLPMNFQFVYRALFYVLFPVLAVLPMGTSFYRDNRTGYIKNICVKASKRNCFSAKYCIAFLAGFVVIFLPMLFDLMIQLCMYPVLPIAPFANLGWVHDGDFMAGIYYKQPLLYALLYCLVDGLFGGIFSVTALCLSRYMKSGFSVLMVPFVYYMISNLVLVTMGQEKYSLYVMVDALRLYRMPGSAIIGGIVMGIGLTYWWFCSYERRKDVL